MVYSSDTLCSLPVFNIQERLSASASTFFAQEYQHSTEVIFDVSVEEGRGDFTTSVALSKAKILGTSPKQIAEGLAHALKSVDGVLSVSVAGSGYVNVTLADSVYIAALPSILSSCTPQKKRDEAPVIVEYSQPNIAKPLGIHHIIGTVVGQAVSNFYEFQGYPVLRWNYIGDWGTQFGKLAVAKQKWAHDREMMSMTLLELLDLYVRFHKEVETDSTLEDQGRLAFLQLEQGDEALRSFWKDVVTVTKRSLADIYRRLHVSFDLDLGESFYEDKMNSILEDGKKKGVFIAGKEGAFITVFPEDSHFPPYLVQKGDGATLYSTRDIAQMKYRTDTYHPQSILIFTDIAQKLHFQQLVATCEQLGWNIPPFENVLFGRMRFADRAMSTRKGNILRLEEALEEAVDRAKDIIHERGEKIQTDDVDALAEMMGVGSLVYGILSQNRKMDMVFDWKTVLSFEGNSAPYVQYTYARARSVLRKAESNGSVANDLVLIPSEKALIKLLLSFTSVVTQAREEHLPHVLTTYIYKLCQTFNTFYAQEPILTAEHHQRELRLTLTHLTATVLKCGAELLTLRVPERM